MQLQTARDAPSGLARLTDAPRLGARDNFPIFSIFAGFRVFLRLRRTAAKQTASAREQPARLFRFFAFVGRRFAARRLQRDRSRRLRLRADVFSGKEKQTDVTDRQRQRRDDRDADRLFRDAHPVAPFKLVGLFVRFVPVGGFVGDGFRVGVLRLVAFRLVVRFLQIFGIFPILLVFPLFPF